MMELSGIYKITCRDNNKFYIGSSINIDRRLKNHISLLKHNKHDNKYLQKDWNKYGEQNFRYEIIETVHNVKQLLIREKWWINTSNCCNKNIGFNISSSPFDSNAKQRFVDLTGLKFDRLTVNKYVGKNKCGNSLWECICCCGNKKIVTSNNLKSYNTKSCGCLRKGINIKHGHCKNKKESKTHIVWRTMNAKCSSNEIKICYRWSNKNLRGFQNFLKDVGKIPENLIFTRINNNKGYSPNNWRLVTRKIQGENRKDNKLFVYNGKTQLLMEWAKEYNINYMTLYNRIYIYKWSIKRALTTPVRERKI